MPHDAAIRDLLDYLWCSPTPFHAASSAESRLTAAGFRVLDMAASWAALEPGGYVVRQGDSAIVAFVLPEGDDIKSVRIIGAHTDSPNLRLKPHAEYTKEGYAQLGVEVYGGMLHNSWLDRDLGIAGRVITRGAAPGRFESRLVCLREPLCRVAQLAIHLDREVNDKGLVLNKQEHLAPIFGLGGESKRSLRTCVAEGAGIPSEQIVSMDLMLYDVNPPVFGGDAEEFIFSARLDNLAMCHAATLALLAARKDGSPPGVVPMIALFDHEEVGSDSAYGAGAPLLERTIERLSAAAGGGREEYHQVLARSLCVSADMAHAVHPNYAERHEPRHKVVLNGGPVIKVNANQRYATSAKTAAVFAELAARAEVPVQYYSHRTDLPCGSTIGPITATRLGIATVDVGNPMLSMHSIREMAGTADHARMIRVQRLFFSADDLAGL